MSEIFYVCLVSIGMLIWVIAVPLAIDKIWGRRIAENIAWMVKMLEKK